MCDEPPSTASDTYWRRRAPNQQHGTDTGKAWSKMQRHIEQCASKYGCYANFYPWIKLNIRPDIDDNSYSGSPG